MAKSKNQPPIVVKDGLNDVSMFFYVSDAASGNKPMVRVYLAPNDGNPTPVQSADYEVASFSTLTANEKTGIRTVATKIRDEVFAKEGWV